MEIVFTILGVILIIALLIACSFLGWTFKGIGAMLQLFTEGLGNFFGTTFGCIIKLIVLISIIAALCL